MLQENTAVLKGFISKVCALTSGKPQKGRDALSYHNKNLTVCVYHSLVL